MEKRIFKMLLMTLPLLTSCEKDDYFYSESTRQTQKDEQGECVAKDGEIRVGEKIESPFLLKNMQRAADSLSRKSGLKTTVVLEPTHYYVRFLPRDSAEYEAIIKDTMLDVYPYPMDRDLTEGDTYHDPSLPYDSYQWQYTTVPTDYDFTTHNVRYEILDNLYILDEDFEDDETELRSAKVTSSPSSAFTWSQLAAEAIRQTTGEEESLRSSKWRPSANITAYDDLLGRYIPLEGVKVRICVFGFIKKSHVTDANGHVEFDKRRRSASYSIEWEREHWDIRDGGTQAYYNGPRQKSTWNLKIGDGAPKSLNYTAIHRALLRYYYNDCGDLSRPQKDIKVSYRHYSDEITNGSTKEVPVRLFPDIFSSIHIYGFSPDGGKRKAYQVMFTAFHELTHVSHVCRTSVSDYWKTKKYIKERRVGLFSDSGI